MRPYSFLILPLLGSYLLVAPAAQAQTSSPDTLTWGSLSADYSILHRARQTAELSELAPSVGLFTVLTPTNAAFDKLPAGTLDELLLPASRLPLSQLLNYHVLVGRHDLATLSSGQRLTTVQGQTVQVQKQSSRIFLRDAQGHLVEVNPTPQIKVHGLRYSLQDVLLPLD